MTLSNAPVINPVRLECPLYVCDAAQVSVVCHKECHLDQIDALARHSAEEVTDAVCWTGGGVRKGRYDKHERSLMLDICEHCQVNSFGKYV